MFKTESYEAKEIESGINQNTDDLKFRKHTAKELMEVCNQNKAKIEVSGGVNINNIGKFLKLGIDYVSVGAITQSAPAVNLSMEIKEI